MSDSPGLVETQPATPANPASNVVGGINENRGFRGNGRTWSSMLDILGMTGHAFRDVSMQEALQQAAVMVCLDVMAQDTSKAEVQLKKRTRSGSGHVGSKIMLPEEHPVAELLWMRPNRFMTWPELVEQTVFHLGLVNNAYWLPSRTLSGRTTGVVPALPGRVRKEVWQERREFVYRVMVGAPYEQVILDSASEFIVFEDEICHFATRRLNGVSGAPTLMLAQRTLAINSELQNFQNRLFRRGDTPKGVFKLPENAEYSQEQYDRLVYGFQEGLRRLSGEDFPLLLENGADFVRMSLTAIEADLKGAWDRTVEDTGRTFRIPPYKLMHYANVKYENMASMAQFYADESLIPRVRIMEERLSWMLLTEQEIRQGLYVEFDREALYVTDMKTRQDRATTLYKTGIITKNRAREMVGENPAPNGEVYQMAANTFLIDENNQVIVTNQASPGDPPGQGDDGDGATDDTKPKPPAGEE